MDAPAAGTSARRGFPDTKDPDEGGGAAADKGGAGAGAGAVSSSAAPAGGSSGASTAGPLAVVHRRQDFLAWDDYFMSVAFLSAQRSKDPNTQVGCCIVDTDNKIVGIGYNGFPRGCSDETLPWARSGKTDLDTKYPYVVHAEANAILNSHSIQGLKRCRMFVALFPCNECAKLIIQSGISEVIFYSDKHRDKVPFVASRRLLDLAGVTYRQHTPKPATVTIDFAAIDR